MHPMFNDSIPTSVVTGDEAAPPPVLASRNDRRGVAIASAKSAADRHGIVAVSDGAGVYQQGTQPVAARLPPPRGSGTVADPQIAPQAQPRIAVEFVVPHVGTIRSWFLDIAPCNQFLVFVAAADDSQQFVFTGEAEIECVIDSRRFLLNFTGIDFTTRGLRCLVYTCFETTGESSTR